ncbi:Aminoglycoside phosphotransferase [Gracilaria domingensis]|nr:Aminoglycoside phosphotransferase [Gracilaria domingensis]
MVEKEFGVEGTILSSLRRLQTNDHGNEELILLFDFDRIVNSNEADRKTWISEKDVCNFAWKPVKSHVQTMQILLDVFHTQTSTRADLYYPVWRTFGWFRCAKKRVFDVLASQRRRWCGRSAYEQCQESEATILRQDLRAGFSRSTCYIQDIDLRKGFRSRGSCDQRQLEVLRAVQVRKYEFFTGPRSAANKAGTDASYSMSHFEDLMESGMKSFSMEWTIANVEKVLRYPGSQYYEKTFEDVFAQHVWSIRRLFQELDYENLPITLVHGDIHLGNIAKQQNPPSSPPTYRIFDWGSAFLGNPLLDVYVLLGGMETNTEDMDRTLDRYMHIWRWKMPIVYFKRMLHIAGLCY